MDLGAFDWLIAVTSDSLHQSTIVTERVYSHDLCATGTCHLLPYKLVHWTCQGIHKTRLPVRVQEGDDTNNKQHINFATS